MKTIIITLLLAVSVHGQSYKDYGVVDASKPPPQAGSDADIIDLYKQFRTCSTTTSRTDIKTFEKCYGVGRDLMMTLHEERKRLKAHRKLVRNCTTALNQYLTNLGQELRGMGRPVPEVGRGPDLIRPVDGRSCTKLVQHLTKQDESGQTQQKETP